MFSRVYVEITNTCNMRCSFCHGHSRPPRQMSREEFDHVLTQLTGVTQYIYYHLMGEPLTHPLLPTFFAMAKERGFHSVITTNGTLLGKKGQALLDAKIHKVNISLHSFEQGDDIALDEYVKTVADFSRKAVSEGIIVCLRLWNKGAEQTENHRLLPLLQKYFPDPWVKNTRGYQLGNRFFLEWDNRFRWPDMGAEDGGDKVFCFGLGNQFGILCDGTVVPCCLDSEGTMNLGNIFTQDIRTILAAPRASAIAQGFQNHIATEELCRRCGYARRFAK